MYLLQLLSKNSWSRASGLQQQLFFSATRVPNNFFEQYTFKNFQRILNSLVFGDPLCKQYYIEILWKLCSKYFLKLAFLSCIEKWKLGFPIGIPLRELSGIAWNSLELRVIKSKIVDIWKLTLLSQKLFKLKLKSSVKLWICG